MILRAHHAALRVADVQEAAGRWSRLYGLTRSDAAGTTLLRCAYEDFCLELRPSDDRGRVEHVAYELREGFALGDAAARLRAAGSAPEEVEVPVRGSGLRVTDPDGNAIVLVERVIPDNRLPPVARFTDELPAFHPRRLQHFNYLTADTPRIAAWYESALGLQISDWIGDGAVWMHADRDHHVVAFLDKGYSHIHHLAFELVDWGEIRVALDHLAQHRRPIAWGPGRHTMAQNLFAYCRMVEEEVFVELFCDMERLEPDHEPRFFADDPHGSNAWGILPPRSYFRFDREAVEAELLQLEAQQGLRD
ncbi:MAG TPA: VOC family protein [Solirubrobacterales bacterium]|jgi:catechol 2,3-dioxygenase-like lactoylglutathione lyase family enzyme|nr:VOC family protein [Solirubrobacterales bacterium]